MNLKDLLALGVEKNIITHTQQSELLDLLNSNENVIKQTSSIIKFLYYLGGFIILCAMSVLMSHTIQHCSYFVILGLGILYSIIFLTLGEFLWRKNEKIPSGILYFLFVSIISLIIVDIEKMTGFFPHFSDIGKIPNYGELCRLPLIVLSLLTIMINNIVQKYRSIDLLAIPTIGCVNIIYFTVLHYIFGNTLFESDTIEYYCLVLSIAIVIFAFVKDKTTKVDYSKWMYLFGALVFNYSILNILSSAIQSEPIFQISIYILSIFYFFTGLLTQRKIFTILGILGVIEAIIYFEFYFIKDNTTLLTSIIIITGLITLYAGVLFNKYSKEINMFIENLLPEKIRNYLPKNRTSEY